MKKKIIYFLGILITVCTSCDDYFTTTPKGSMDADEFYTQINNLRLGLNSVYDLLQTEDYQLSELCFGEALSDNSWNSQDNRAGDMGELLNFQFNTDNSYILTRYQVNYRGINMANQVISAVPNLNFREAYDLNYKEIREVVGQAKLLRALFYFNLVRTFGGVSIQPEETALSKKIVPRSSASEVYAYIEKDLREACLILRTDRYQKDEAGQAGIGAGLGLLMKVLVYQASPGIKLDGVDRDEKWQEAKEVAELFIDGIDMTYEKMLKYSERYDEPWADLCKRLGMNSPNDERTPQTLLRGVDIVNIHSLDDFDKIFRLDGQFSKESLLEVNHYDYSFAGVGYEETNFIYGCLNHNQDHDLGPTPTENLANAMNNDPRKLYTMVRQSELTSDFFKDSDGNQVDLGWWNTGAGYLFCKYMVYPNEGSEGERNYRIMRYAEVLLLYAEILNETGDQTRATEMVNRVRARAAKLLTDSSDSKYNPVLPTNFNLYDVLPYDMLRDNIINERRVELAAEFDRWYDIVRLGIVNQSMKWLADTNTPDPNSGQIRWRGIYFKRGVNEIFPIPQKEITISNGVITQNFGY